MGRNLFRAISEIKVVTILQWTSVAWGSSRIRALTMPIFDKLQRGEGCLVSQIHNLLWTILSRLSPILDVSQFSGDDATKSSCAVVMQGDKYFQRLVSSQPQRKCIKNYHFKPSSSNLITEHCNGFPQRSIANCYCCSRGVSEILPATRNKNCCQSWN